jgi:hypothetical protein
MKGKGFEPAYFPDEPRDKPPVLGGGYSPVRMEPHMQADKREWGGISESLHLESKVRGRRYGENLIIPDLPSA